LGVEVFNPFQVPLLNTVVLLSSGVRVTWAHHSLISGEYTQILDGLTITIILGIYFTILQGLEYYEARFTFADSIYGATFFIATGFHGIHVIVGTIFLAVTLIRHTNCEFRLSHHFGFEAAAWY
jgi:cytochrome c oxidase subunit 3